MGERDENRIGGSQMKQPETTTPEEPVLPCCGLPERDHIKKPLTLAQATVRVGQLSHLGYTVEIVVHDLLSRIEKLESRIRELETVNARLRVQP